MEEVTKVFEPINSVHLQGIILEEPVFSHENHGKRFGRFVLSVKRLSGVYDHLNIVAEETLLTQADLWSSPMLYVEGQIRTYHNHSGQGPKLIIYVYAMKLCPGGGPDENLTELVGTVCRPPVFRRTPLGREICDVILAVERKYHRRDYIPCILWGSVARMASQLGRGTILRVEGRFQSRSYIKQTEEGSEERTAFEVSAITAEVLTPER